MAMYLGSKKVAVTNTIEKQIPSMKAFFDAGGKCGYSTATSFDGCWRYNDMDNVTNMDSMFYNCPNLTAIPQLDTSNVTSMDSMFYNCSSIEVIHMVNISADLDISSSTKFTREALLEILGNLKALTSETKTLIMGSTNLAKLTDEDKAIATNKGWTLA